MKPLFVRTMIALLVLVFAVQMLACSPQGNAEVELPDGYLYSDVISGGRNVPEANLKTVTASVAENELTFVFRFVCGSLISEASESNAVAVPSYSVTMLQNPTRLELNFEALPFMDYKHTLNLSNVSDYVFGGFDVALEGSDAKSVYIQLKNNSCFNVSENKNELTISVLKYPEQPGDDEYAYYVTANACLEYEMGAFVPPDGMKPSLTRDDSGIIFISDALPSQKEANKRLEEYKNQYDDYIAVKFGIVALYSNDLPIYNESFDNARAYTELVARVEGVEMALNVFLEDGLFLAYTPQNDILYSKKIKKTDSIFWELWVAKEEGEERLLRFEFDMIEDVQFSGNGKRLAVLENAADSSHLYIFNMDTHELIVDLATAGLGRRISSFVWNQTGTVIYTISGTETMQVNMYDFSIMDDTKRKSVLYAEYTDESTIGLFEGEVYFVLLNEDTSMIYSMRPEGGVKKPFVEGSAFAFSNDGRYVAVTTASAVSQENASQSLFIMDMQTGERFMVEEDFPVFNFVWSADSSMLYYIKNKFSAIGESEGEFESETEEDAEADSGDTQEPESPTDEYPYTLYVYDMDAKTITWLCDLRHSSIYATSAENDNPAVYIPYYDTQTMGSLVCATYVFEKE